MLLKLQHKFSGTVEVEPSFPALKIIFLVVDIINSEVVAVALANLGLVRFSIINMIDNSIYNIRLI